ncbi:o-succinylbenzoate synthase [Moheibacter sediminis]|uniref:O-succinylbenzoate synthase n=1 Tax=Moheibacter sediminis TaxID=1434700 RepID=A0A1W2CTT9_9FLAO|nr:o-succinylbenzoate synthase [Moheibacter sediminis]SMC88659.1 o-succinylbenzoate synthase [Moheibacter sediminis]
MKTNFQSYKLILKKPSGTSRGVLHKKETFLLKTENNDETEFYGECGIFRGLSADDRLDYEEKLNWVCQNLYLGLDKLYEELREFPSIQFGVEQIFKSKEKHKIYKVKKDVFNPILFPSEFTKGNEGIPINGLIWMGNEEFMRNQIKEKLNSGFHCIKLKIGVDWEMEHEILKNLRNEFSENDLELRVDANGGFSFEEAKTILQELTDLKIHSIEQPIKSGNIDEMAELCQITPMPIALDEELIGIFYPEEKKKLLQEIQPQYIILKPSLVGGWRGSEEWINFANELGINWWITSALESSIGLNAIAQWTFTLNNPMPQGLGTGGLFENNFPSKLEVRGDNLYFS